MKELAALTFLIVLVWVGWNQPYKAHFTSVVADPPAIIAPVAENRAPTAATPQTAVTAAPQATPAENKSWMWKKTTMDAPYKSKGDNKDAR